ncbi:MAG: type IV pilus twitching motility protein PilT [Planctomycetota bacterium]
MADPTKEELLFGRIALHNKLINQDQYAQALSQRSSNGGKPDFGRVLRELGAVDDRQYKTIRRAQEKALLGKGFNAEEAKFVARGLNRDGSSPADEAPRAEEPAEVEFEEVEEDDDPTPASVPAEAKGPLKFKRPVDPKAAKVMQQLFQKARDSGASDLHMSCGAKPWLRLHGGVHFVNMPEITPETGQLYAAAFVSDHDWDQFMRTKDWDGSVAIPGLGRYRANLLFNRTGVSAVYRVVKTEIPTFEELGLPEVLAKLTTFPQGLVLVTGATGSGKSSTLAAMIEMINQSRKDHIITMEDPIEFLFKGAQCNITQREVHKHTRSWSNALRASLREDPDVIMVGEMRDLETISMAITAAETGHLVFGTLHTSSATRTIDRLLDVYPPAEQPQIRAMVSESLRGVVSQILLPKKDGKGRVAALEILFWTPAVANLIREGSTYKLISVLQTGKKQGMCLMDDSIMTHLKAGTITKEVARMAAANPKLFQ